MNKKMKILIGYDGSDHAYAIFKDLLLAGLPGEAEVRVVSVGELCIMPSSTYGMVDTEFADELSRPAAPDPRPIPHPENLPVPPSFCYLAGQCNFARSVSA